MISSRLNYLGLDVEEEPSILGEALGWVPLDFV